MDVTTRFDADEFDVARRRRRRMITIGAIVLAVLVAIGAVVAMRRAKPAEAKPAGAPHVTFMVPGAQTVTRQISATGAIAARRDMPIGIAGEGGMVSRVLVEAGDWVRQGQVLAVIERSVQTQQADALAASITVARADAALAQANLTRAQALVARGFISRADIDSKTAARDQANARVRVAQAQLNEQRARLGRLNITAPAAGRILTRSVEAGQIVGGSGTLFRMAENGALEMQARLAEPDLVTLHPGLGAQVTPVGSTRSFEGRIWQLSAVIDPASRQGIARIALPADPALRPGGFATATIAGGSATAPLLPESAVLSDAKGNFVYLVGPNDTIMRRDVKVGGVDDRGVTVLSGLSGREHVVVSAGAFLNVGDKITPELQPQAR